MRTTEVITIPSGHLVLHYNEDRDLIYIDYYKNEETEELRYYPAVVSNRIEALIHLVDEPDNIVIGDECECVLDVEECE